MMTNEILGARAATIGQSRKPSGNRTNESQSGTVSLFLPARDGVFLKGTSKWVPSNDWTPSNGLSESALQQFSENPPTMNGLRVGTRNTSGLSCDKKMVRIRSQSYGKIVGCNHQRGEALVQTSPDKLPQAYCSV